MRRFSAALRGLNSYYLVECSAARHVECLPATARGASAALIGENTPRRCVIQTHSTSWRLRCASWGVRASGLRGESAALIGENTLLLCVIQTHNSSSLTTGAFHFT